MRSVGDAVDSLCHSLQQHRGDHLLFVVSFDGVLTEYQDDPGRAEVPPERLARLRSLVATPAVTVAVVSGRPLADVRSRAPVGDGAFYIGLHGLEVSGPHLAWACSEAWSLSDDMQLVACRLRALVADVPRARVEAKGPILALHTRAVAADDVVWSRFQLLSAAADLVNSNTVRALRGHDVLELMPNVPCTRGAALRRVRQQVEEHGRPPVFTLYVGDDRAEDTAVAAAREHGVAAVVGRRGQADVHLTSAADVDVLLDALLHRGR